MIALARLLFWCLLDKGFKILYPPTSGQTVALIRLDGIGDFIIWQAAAHRYRSLYPGRALMLICSEQLAELARALPYWDQVIGVDLAKLYSSPRYRYTKLLTIRSLGLSTLINPVYSRATGVDILVRAIGCRENIGYDGQSENLKFGAKRLTDRWYSNLVIARGERLTELERSDEFTRSLGWKGPALILPNIELPARSNMAALPASDYFVVFPGASWAGRRWPLERFAEMTKWIAFRYGWTPVTAGGSEDKSRCEALCKLIGGNMIDLSGKSSLLDMAECLRRAKLLVSNDTSAVHMAAALATPTVAVLGGGHFGRFLPYPKTGNLPVSAYSQMSCFNCDWQCVFPVHEHSPKPCIEAVTVDMVKAAVVEALQQDSNQPC